MKKCKITKAAFVMPTVCLALGALASCGEKQGTEIPKVIADLVVFSNIYAYRGPAFLVAIVLYTFEIYLDFINLFLKLLRLMGKRK